MDYPRPAENNAGYPQNLWIVIAFYTEVGKEFS